MVAGRADAVTRPRKTPVHYAWWVLLATVVISILSGGIGVFSYSAFFSPWESEFGWSRGEISLALSISTLLSGLLSPWFGRWTDRYGVRRVAIMGAILMGLAFMAIAAIGVFPLLVGSFALPALYVMFVVLTFGRTGIANIPLSTAIANWFVKRRGLAMGVMSMGVGIGGVVIAPLIAFIIAGMGWRAAFVIGGMLILVIVLPVSIFVLRNRPGDKGLSAYGLEDLPGEAGIGPLPEVIRDQLARSNYRWTFGEAMRTSSFWYLSFAQGLFFFGNSVILQHAFPLFMEKGEPLAVAAGFLSTIAALSALGKAASGFVVDKMSTARYVHMGSMLFQGVGIAIILFANSTPLYWLGVIIIGLSQGGAVALQPVMLGECFGIGSFGALLGASSVIVTILSSLGPLFAGLTHDWTGNYQLALIITVVLELVAGTFIFFARPVRLASPKS